MVFFWRVLLSVFFSFLLQPFSSKTMDDDDYNPLLNGGGGASNGTVSKKSSKQLSVEKIYQKKSQLEHILLRPDTYIGE